jgi:acyl-CoA reductase-like NAD-dependent aldehyde dehydrogenase
MIPISGVSIHSSLAATVQHATTAVESASRAFDTWRNSTPLERRTIFTRAAQILEDRKDELVDAMVREMGAKPSWAAFNITLGIEFVMEAVGMATQVKGEVHRSNDPGEWEASNARNLI